MGSDHIIDVVRDDLADYLVDEVLHLCVQRRALRAIVAAAVAEGAVEFFFLVSTDMQGSPAACGVITLVLLYSN